MKIILFLFIFTLANCAIRQGEEDEEDEEERRAVAELDIGNQNNQVRGRITFFQRNPSSKVKVSGRVSGLEPGKTGRNYHGLHIHALDDISNGCDSTGGHFNPKNTFHGDRKDKESKRHSGDFGNLIVNRNGNVNVKFHDKYITLYGENSIIGRPLVVHADEDDLGRGGDEGSRATGNSGKRLACGIIKEAN